MRFNLSLEERRVFMCFQAQEEPLLSSQVAAYLDLPEYQVLKTMESLAEQELIRLEDGAGELSVLGTEYNLLDDESIDEVLEGVASPTRIVLQYFLDDPKCLLSAKRLETDDGLTPEEIDAALEECECLGYPVKARIRT